MAAGKPLVSKRILTLALPFQVHYFVVVEEVVADLDLLMALTQRFRRQLDLEVVEGDEATLETVVVRVTQLVRVVVAILVLMLLFLFVLQYQLFLALPVQLLLLQLGPLLYVGILNERKN